MLSNVCPYCENQIENIEIHSKQDYETLNCDNCNLVTSNKVCLEQHRKTVHETALKLFACEVCNIDFSDKKFLFIHKDFSNNHQQEANFDVKVEALEIKEEICEIDDFIQESIVDDLLYVQEENIGSSITESQKFPIRKDKLLSQRPDFQCDICDHSFSHLPNLRVHKLTVHNDTKHYKCGQCENSFKSEYYFNRHVRIDHGDNFEYKCEVCEKGFSNEPKLTKHRKSVHELKKMSGAHICSACDKSSSSTQYLHMHFASTHDGKISHKCNLCDKQYKTASNLKRHNKAIHDGVQCNEAMNLNSKSFFESTNK